MYDEWQESLFGNALHSSINLILNNKALIDTKKKFCSSSSSYKNYCVEIYFKKLIHRQKVEYDVRYICETNNFPKFLNLVSSQDVVYIFFIRNLLWREKCKIVRGVTLWRHYSVSFDCKDNTKNLCINDNLWNSEYKEEFEFLHA